MTFSTEWNGGIEKKGLCQNDLILSTFANGHITQLRQLEADLENGKPVGVLLLAMQAVGCALQCWESGELSDEKPKHFSLENYGDTRITVKMDGPLKKVKVQHATVFASSLCNMSDAHWVNIISKVQKHLLRDRNNAIPQSRDHSGTGSSTLVNDDEELNPDGDFIMDVK
ncbi:hypothetical protein APHAL10511_003512 [Amanita phalloides]|nr:hypothetical protein APHAL10511_003512 [Amanita phalloides]